VGFKRTDEQVLHTTNKHNFRLKGIIRCGKCGSAICGYVRHKKNGKVYRYYKCLSKVNGVPVDCSFTSIGADKLEEFIIEQLAILGWDREFLTLLVEKAKEMVSNRIEPLKQEKHKLEGRLSNLKSSINNLIELAKRTPNQKISDELTNLDNTKREMELRLSGIQAELSYCGKVVFDIDVIEQTLRNFAKYIYKLPVELQIRTIQLIIKQVLVFKDRIRLELYELPIDKINEIMNGKYIEKGIKDLTSSNHGESRGRKPNTNYIELKSSNPVHLPLNPMGFELNGGYYG